MATDLLNQKTPGALVASDGDNLAGSMLNFVATAVKDPNIDVAKLRALLEMQREIIADDAKTQFTRALHKAQAEIPAVDKNGTVSLGIGKGSYQFATFEDMNKVLRPVMARHGFTISFDMATKPGEGGGAIITGTLTHEAGHSRTASIPLALDSGPGRNNLQAMGSTLSYGKRYLCEMFFNIVRKGADDDGVAAGMKFIGPGQLAELEKLLTDTNSDHSGFLRFMGVDTLKDIQVKDFVAAVNALMAKKKKGAQP